MAVKKWRGKWVVDLRIHGKRIRRVSPVQSKRGALRYEAELRLGRGELDDVDGVDENPDSDCPTLAEFAPEWLVTYAVTNNKPAERIRKEKVLRVHLVPFFGNLRLDQITSRRVDAYKANRLRKGYKASSVNAHLATLNKLLVCAMDWGYIDRTPRIRRVPLPEQEFDWLRPDEADRLLACAREHEPMWFVFIMIALHTGLRKGEILALHWREVDFTRQRVTVKYTWLCGALVSPKSKKSRRVPMTDDLLAVLADWRLKTPGKLVLPSSKGTPLGPIRPNRALHRLLETAGLRPMRVHDLRHTFASHLVLHGRSLREVQLLLGHHSITMTEKYAHIGADQLATAIRVLDRKRVFDQAG